MKKKSLILAFIGTLYFIGLILVMYFPELFGIKVFSDVHVKCIFIYAAFSVIPSIFFLLYNLFKLAFDD